MLPYFKKIALVSFACAALLLPRWVTNDYYLHQIILVAIYAILLFGLDIVVGYTGEVSLAHGALLGIGAYAAAILNTTYGWPLLATLPASMLVTAFFGGLLALPALRVRGPYLAMVTLAFGTITEILINEMDFLTNGAQGISLQPPALGSYVLDERHYYSLVIGLFMLTAWLTRRLLTSRFGRAFEALRGSPIAADCMGVAVYRYKVLAFVVSAGLAGLAGSLFSFNELYVAPSSFNFELTITFLLALIMGGKKSLVGAVLGAFIVVLLPNLLDDIHLFRALAHGVLGITVGLGLWSRWHHGATFSWRAWVIPGLAVGALEWGAHRLQDMTDWRLTIFGALILFVVYYLQDGIVGWWRQTHVNTVKVPLRQRTGEEAPSLTFHAVAKPGSLLLEVDHLVMTFGGLRALNDVSVKVYAGMILGLIGPNGSGKSTFMNVLSGLYRPQRGVVSLVGKTLTGRSPAQIARWGVARTFQNLQLFGDMTVLENVMVGLNHGYRSGFWATLAHTPRWRQEEREAEQKALALLAFVGLQEDAARAAHDLSYGQQRWLEIARALALDPQLLLLDEPAAGLNGMEIERLVLLLRRIQAQGLTIILIEHHMDVVMAVSDQVLVLDSGQCLAQGKPEVVRQDPLVMRAYLGTEGETA